MADKCQIQGCDRDSNYRHLHLCHRCYQALYYWRKKSVAEVIRRKNKLRMFMSRMELVEPVVTEFRKPTPKRKKETGNG